jgi:hypothetical protein
LQTLELSMRMKKDLSQFPWQNHLSLKKTQWNMINKIVLVVFWLVGGALSRMRHRARPMWLLSSGFSYFLLRSDYFVSLPAYDETNVEIETMTQYRFRYYQTN